MITKTLRKPIRSIFPRGITIVGGIGDHFFLSAVAHELWKRGHGRVFITSEFPDLFRRNPAVPFVPVPRTFSSRSHRIAAGPGGFHILSYNLDHDVEKDTRTPPPEHVIGFLCRLAGVTGTVALRPYIYLDESEVCWADPYRGCIVIQSTGQNARSLNPKFTLRNKQWFPERFGQVSEALMAHHQVVQVGHPNDPPIPCHHDLRGQTDLRQLGALLTQARLVVAQEGMLGHMARAVECPSVIVWGGRTRPDQLGYSCNGNLYNPLPCSPCWLDYRCDFDRKCLDDIKASHVLAMVDEMLNRPRGPLAVDHLTIE